MKEKECSAVVPSGGQWGSFNRHRCERKPTKYENNKWWCTIHSPSYKAAKRYKEDEAFEAKMVRSRENRKRQEAISELVEGVSTEFIEQHPDILKEE